MPPRAHLMASEETELKEQLEVASQLLDDSVNPWRITCSQRKGVIDSLQEQTEESSEEHSEEPEAKSLSESETYEGLRNLFLTLPEPEPEMSTSGAAAPDVKPKEETTDEDWATMIATSVIDAMTNKKDETDKTLLPDVYEGNHKDTRGFLLDLKLYFKMNPAKSKCFFFPAFRAEPRNGKSWNN
ncbi:hypothetical protein Moror_9271 [Moniliophthora roreri MCA 2997]|uniref:Reverse transcriptase-rnase h-integrase n=1 Tax=Moniliophthora roreri (strain MCA 2997) TaxID=1381753 RepID=V2WDK2_MONRO|nr:hypothetical protein Moror_9271 [Moniliophthora roreri MCA 2997]